MGRLLLFPILLACALTALLGVGGYSFFSVICAILIASSGPTSLNRSALLIATGSGVLSITSRRYSAVPGA